MVHHKHGRAFAAKQSKHRDRRQSELEEKEGLLAPALTVSLIILLPAKHRQH